MWELTESEIDGESFGGRVLAHLFRIGEGCLVDWAAKKN